MLKLILWKYEVQIYAELLNSIQEMVSVIDQDGDGDISFNEFVWLMTKYDRKSEPQRYPSQGNSRTQKLRMRSGRRSRSLTRRGMALLRLQVGVNFFNSLGLTRLI